MSVEPVVNAPAAIVNTGSERILVIADYHAGIETVLRSDGVELDDGGAKRRQRVRQLLEQTAPDRLVVLGDLVHAIGDVWTEEREEVDSLLSAITVPVTVVKGNHDGEIESLLSVIDTDVTVTPSSGIRIGPVGFVHGHTWPSRDVLSANFLCVGHEHPTVRLEDSVGGTQHERVWLRGTLSPEPFENHLGEEIDADGELIVFPAFNDLSGGTWINVEGQEFLSPFLPDGIVSGEAYLLDGTRLGPYRSI